MGGRPASRGTAVFSLVAAAAFPAGAVAPRRGFSGVPSFLGMQGLLVAFWRLTEAFHAIDRHHPIGALRHLQFLCPLPSEGLLDSLQSGGKADQHQQVAGRQTRDRAAKGINRLISVAYLPLALGRTLPDQGSIGY